MALTKQVVIDSINVTEIGVVEVREATTVMDGGVQIGSKSFYRFTIAPGEDYSTQDAKVKAICKATHTASCVAEYEALMAANNLRLGLS